MESIKKRTILVADDDPDDFYLLKDALSEAGVDCDLRVASDGTELMDYLLHKKEFMAPENAPYPVFILLDLNMPKKNGREALAEIKSIENLKQIPVIVYTTSDEPEDIRDCYAMGANSFVRKPASFDSLVDTMKTMTAYWFNVANLPSPHVEMLEGRRS